MYLYGLVQLTLIIVFNFQSSMLVSSKAKLVQIIPNLPWAMSQNMAVRDLAFGNIYNYCTKKEVS